MTLWPSFRLWSTGAEATGTPVDGSVRSTGRKHPVNYARRSLATTCLALLPMPRAAGSCPPRGARVHAAVDVRLHTQEAFPHITSLKKSMTRCQGGFISFFLKDDKCIDINIFLVLMATIFKRGWSWLISLPTRFYLSWTFHASSVPRLWGGCPDPPQASDCLRY